MPRLARSLVAAILSCLAGAACDRSSPYRDDTGICLVVGPPGERFLCDAAPSPDGAIGETPCDPVAQTGCSAGEKCTWVVVSDEPPLGKTDCVADGSVALGEACTPGEPGAVTGFDDCVAGGVCREEGCVAICDAGAGTMAACAEGGVCVVEDGLFDDSGAGTVFGLCRVESGG